MHRRVAGRLPHHPPGACRPARQQQPVTAQRQQHLPAGARFSETAEHRGDRLHHRLIRSDHRAGLVVVETDRQELPQLTAGGLVPQPGGQPGPDQMQLGLAHRALQTEHQPVVEIRRVVDAVGVGDQRVGQRAQVQQLIPVGVVAGQPADLDAEDDAHSSQADIGDQILEPFPTRRLRPRTGPGPYRSPAPDAHPNPKRPHVRAASIGGSGFRCAPQLGQGGLPDIHVSVPDQMNRTDLGRHQHRGHLTHRHHPVPRRRCPGRSAHRAINRASSVSTSPRVDSGSDHHRSAGRAGPRSGSASWTVSAATLKARK